MGNLITLNVSQIGINVNLGAEIKSKVGALLELMAINAHDKWTTLADEELTSTSSDYIAGINAPVYEENKVTILLTGKFPIMVETGVGSFDMKPGLLEGAQAKITKDGEGKYVTVPFRHGTPGRTGRNFPSMEAFVAPIAERLSPTVEMAGGKISWGDRLQGRGEMFVPKTKPMVGKRTAPYTHTRGIYEGMVRAVKEYAKGPQAHYFTMRRVSTRRVVNGKIKGSDPNSWIHPGLSGAGLIPKVKEEVEKNAKGMARAVGLAVT